MFEMASKIVPPGLLFGLALYCGLCFIWLQPLVEKRLAERAYIPQCEAVVREARIGVDEQLEQQRTRRQAILDAYKSLLGQFADIPGASDVLALSGGLAPVEAPRLKKPNLIDSTTLCGCAASAAFEDVKIPMLLHVASLRVYHPSAIEKLPYSIARIVSSGQCGEAHAGVRHD